MRIIAISSLGSYHRFVLEQLHQRFPLTAVIQPRGLSKTTPVSRTDKFRKGLRHPLQFVETRLQRWHNARQLRKFEEALENALFPCSGESSGTLFDSITQTIERDQLNSVRCQELMERLEPDLIITSGCPLLRPGIFETPRLGTLNVHWGIAPAYRGEDTLFWPLYFGDFTQLGGTIHQIDQSIDRGPLLSQYWPELNHTDTEETITRKTAYGLGRQIVTVVEQIAQQNAIHGIVPEAKGRMFSRKLKTWRHDVVYALRRKAGQLKPSSLAEREYFAVSRENRAARPRHERVTV